MAHAPQPKPAPRPSPVKRPMVSWYNPIQLTRTASQVVVSTVLGTRADFRLLESFSQPQGVFNYSTEPDIWIDWVADLGDGWDSTYAIATLLAAPTLELRTNDRRIVAQTSRGRLLIMGGDEVYPTASRQGYKERTEGPYAHAFPHSDPPHPAVFAIPGNHDWYDGLISFTRLFCQNRWLGGWQTQQRRSYFAIKLPGNWWLWGVDVQLESDIDQPQLDYFYEIANKYMMPGDQVILATAEPNWVYGNIYDPALQKNLAFLERKVLRDYPIRVAIAGDLHHYRRHQSEDDSKTQLITAGGGGAFLHPTFGPPVDTLELGEQPEVRTFRLQDGAEFPDQKTSKRLLLRDLVFPWFNPSFGLLTGALYLVIAWVLRAPVQRELEGVGAAAATGAKLDAFVRGVLGSPSAMFWVVLIVLGFIAFTETHKTVYRVVAGGIHGFAHLGSVLLVNSGITLLIARALRLQPGSSLWLLAMALGLFAGGYVAGSWLVGLYLYISLRCFRRHANEAFSALHIPDYKNFVRMHISRAGDLTIYPVGVEEVPRRWTAVEPFLIEPPIVVPPLKLGKGRQRLFGGSD